MKCDKCSQYFKRGTGGKKIKGRFFSTQINWRGVIGNKKDRILCFSCVKKNKKYWREAFYFNIFVATFIITGIGLHFGLKKYIRWYL